MKGGGNGELSLAGGAIRGWDKRSFYYFQMLKAVADHYGFDPEAPFDELTKDQQRFHKRLGARLRSRSSSGQADKIAVVFMLENSCDVLTTRSLSGPLTSFFEKICKHPSPTVCRCKSALYGSKIFFLLRCNGGTVRSLAC